MIIRKSTWGDLDRMMAIYAHARQFMAEHGNPNQWGPTHWPPEALIQSDIRAGDSYVCVDDGGEVVGTFYFVSGEGIEPTYRAIEDGKWLDDSPYGVVHRIASDGSRRGVGAFCIDWAYQQCGHLRIDTHGDNVVMQGLLRKLGFVHCGTIHVVEDDAPRLAFEKSEWAERQRDAREWGTPVTQDAFSRTQMLLGSAAMDALARSRVAVFGVGGVGGYVCEALARSGVGAFELIDSDRVGLTNLNRQIIATLDAMGRYKVDAMAARMRSINPNVDVAVRRCFFLPENADTFDFASYDYVVDAVDTVAAKLAIIERAKACGVPVISAMGAGNKLDPGRFRVSDIEQTHTCPLARVMRRELKKRGIARVKVVWSDEAPRRPVEAAGDRLGGEPRRRDVPGSTAFVPAVAGLMLAGEVVRDLAGVHE